MLNLSEKECELLLRFIGENITENIINDKIELPEVSTLGNICNTLIDYLDERKTMQHPTIVKKGTLNGQISRHRYARSTTRQLNNRAG